MTFEQAHNERRDQQIHELQEGMGKIITLLDEEQGRGRREEHQRRVDTHENESTGEESHPSQGS